MELLWAVVITGAFLGTPDAPPSAAEALMREVEGRQGRLQDMTARFTQTYTSGALGREVVERGTVSIKLPGRMLWEYQDPERKTFVSDGKTTYFYVPADRQVIVRDQTGDQGILGRLLSGRESLLSHFDVALAEVSGGLRGLRLIPRRPDPDVEGATLGVDEAGRIRTIVVVDVQGNRSTFRFEGIEENRGLPEKMFRFTIPRGVEVVAG